MAEEVPIEKALPDFCLFYVEPALQLLNRRARKNVGNITRLVSHDNFDAREFCTHVVGLLNCKQIVDDSRGDATAAEGFK